MIRPLPLAMPALLLAACVHGDSSQSRADLRLGPETELSPSGEAFQHALIAEIALSRYEYVVAAREYQLAAELSEDPELAARATRVATQLGRHEEATASARRWAVLEPERLEPHEYLAVGHLRRGQVDAGVIELQLYGVPNPEVMTFADLSQWLVLRRVDPDIAVEVMQNFAAAYPDDPTIDYELARIAMRAGQFALALESAGRATRAAPDSIRAALLYAQALVDTGQSDAAIAYAQQHLTGTAEPERRLEFASVLADAGDRERARQILEQLLAEEPMNAGVLLAMALVEFQDGRLAESREYFQELARTGQYTFNTRYFLGSIADVERDFDRALRFYSQVVAGDYVADAQIRMAYVLFKMGLENEAMEHLQSFAKLNPALAIDVLLVRSELLGDAKQYDAALNILNEGIEKHPQERSLLYARAFLFDAMGQVDDAIEQLEEILKDDPEDATALNALGYTLADRTTRYAEALDFIEKALSLNPTSPAIIDSMGWVHYRLGDYDVALDYLEEAYARSHDPEVAAHLGEVLWMLGETTRAREIWDAALLRNPDHVKLNEAVERFVQ